MKIKNIIDKTGSFLLKRLSELIGASLLIFSMLFLASLVSYSPEDPNFIFPENTEIKNLLGSKGSYASDILYQSIGLISLLIPISFFFISLSIIIEKKILNLQKKMMALNRTFTMIKPDAVKKGYIGAILNKINIAGFKIVSMKMTQISKRDAELFYSIHKARPFFNDLVAFMTSGPIVAAVLEKENAVNDFRNFIKNFYGDDYLPNEPNNYSGKKAKMLKKLTKL